jgi:hypothetical protein
MPQTPIPINNPVELDTLRSETVQKLPGFTMVNNGTTGQEYSSFTHAGGASLTYNIRTTSEFNPNNKQTLTQGNSNNTVRGDSFKIVEGVEEKRIFGDLNIITGSPNFFNNSYASEYIAKRADLAGALTAPECTVGGYGNNTKATYEQKGSVNPETGSAFGGTFQPNPIREGLPELIEKTQGELISAEQNLGTGGNIKLLSTKHLMLMAGSETTTFDSALIIPNGRAVKGETTVSSGEFKQKSIPVGQVEPKATTLNMPFGDINIFGSNSIQLAGGAGGLNFTCAGSVNLVGTGVTIIGGAQTIIQGGVGVSINTPYTEVNSDQCNINSSSTFIDGKLSVAGDLVIEGNLSVQGDVFVKGKINCTGIIKSDTDVIAGTISLKNHIHGGSPKPS